MNILELGFQHSPASVLSVKFGPQTERQIVTGRMTGKRGDLLGIPLPCHCSSCAQATISLFLGALPRASSGTWLRSKGALVSSASFLSPGTVNLRCPSVPKGLHSQYNRHTLTTTKGRQESEGGDSAPLYALLCPT